MIGKKAKMGVLSPEEIDYLLDLTQSHANQELRRQAIITLAAGAWPSESL